MRGVAIEAGIWRRADMLSALASRDIRVVYRLLQRHGVSQRRIAAMTGQSQSEISEILGGRRVLSYDVLVRIADGLGVSRGHLGLAYDGADGPGMPRTADGPVRDLGSGRWMVRVPVYADSYGAAAALCAVAPVGATGAAAATATAGNDVEESVPGVDGAAEVAPQGWRLAARTVLRSRLARLRASVHPSTRVVVRA